MDNFETTGGHETAPVKAGFSGNDIVFDFDIKNIYSDIGLNGPGAGSNLVESQPRKADNAAAKWLPSGDLILDVQRVCESFGDKVSDQAGDKLSGQSGDKLNDKTGDRNRPLIPGDDPVAKIHEALDRLDAVDEVTVSRLGANLHKVNVDFKSAQCAEAPNIRVKGFSPQMTHTAEKVSFNMSGTETGVKLSSMQGFSSTVLGPLGRLRNSTSQSMDLGVDRYGPYIDSSSSMRVLFKNRSSSVRLRENNFDEGSPMRQLMHQPQSLEKVSSMMRLFRDTDDINSFNLKNNRDGTYDVNVGANEGENIKIDEKLEDLEMTVESIDLDKRVSARIKQSKENNAVGLEDIKGLTVNLDTKFGDIKVSPLRVAMRNDSEGNPVLELEVKNPNIQKASVSLEIPVKDPKVQKATIKLQVPMAKLIYDSVTK